METTTQTTRQALEAAGKALGQQGITLVLTSGTKTSGDAWCDAVEKHGERIGHIYLNDGTWAYGGRPRYYTHDGFVDATTLYVSYPYTDVEIGKAIQQALVAQGFTVEWDGEPTSAVKIRL